MRQHQPPFDPREPVPGWTVDRHLDAFASGYFPMAISHRELDLITESDDSSEEAWLELSRQDPQPVGMDNTERDIGEVHWYMPRHRALLPLTPEAGLHIPRGIARLLRRNHFSFRTDTAFEEVVRRCSRTRSETDRPWIDRRIFAMYRHLHAAGHAHSMEACRTDPRTGETHVVGGIYGLSIGSIFFAESMFHEPRPRLPGGERDPLDGTNASSCALIRMCDHLHACGYTVLDVQMKNEHTERFGVEEIHHKAFDRMLDTAVRSQDRWRPLGPKLAGSR
jgi:leucyl/phenylalanyl-tRNA--protein transferase